MSKDEKKKYLLSGAEEIGEAIGENKDNIGNLVKNEGLPAWKRTKKSPWKAHPEHIERWAREQAEKYLEKTG